MVPFVSLTLSCNPEFSALNKRLPRLLCLFSDKALGVHFGYQDVVERT